MHVEIPVKDWPVGDELETAKRVPCGYRLLAAMADGAGSVAGDCEARPGSNLRGRRRDNHGLHGVLMSFAVRPDLRGCGIGQRMAASMLSSLKGAGAATAFLFSRRRILLGASWLSQNQN